MSLPTPSLTATIINGAVVIKGHKPPTRTYAARQQAEQVCSACTETGHNRRTCPKIGRGPRRPLRDARDPLSRFAAMQRAKAVRR